MATEIEVEKASESIAELAKTIYEERIRAQVEATHFGDFVALDVDSGDWEVDKDLLSANSRLRARRPQTRTFFLRVGYRTAFNLGGSTQSRLGKVS